jgi:hypothetical protein
LEDALEFAGDLVFHDALLTCTQRRGRDVVLRLT